MEDDVVQAEDQISDDEQALPQGEEQPGKAVANPVAGYAVEDRRDRGCPEEVKAEFALPRARGRQRVRDRRRKREQEVPPPDTAQHDVTIDSRESPPLRGNHVSAARSREGATRRRERRPRTHRSAARSPFRAL